MQQSAKIQFSAREQSLMGNAEWILTKNGIMEKMKALLQQCLEVQQQVMETERSKLPAEIFNTPPKISRGENYQGLPWLMLDYPRQFEKETQPDGQAGIFAIRSFFWWGNFFSCTLHLSGRYKKKFEEKILNATGTLSRERFFICVHDQEWDHHFEKNNYRCMDELDEAAIRSILSEKHFIKLAVRFEIDQWDELPELTGKFFNTMLEILV